MANAKRDQNFVTTLLAVSSLDGITPVPLWADPVTHRLLVDATGSSTTITPITVSGTIDDSNTVFTTLTPPTVLVINGSIYQKTGGAITWSGTTTLTLSSPIGLGGSIFGL